MTTQNRSKKSSTLLDWLDLRQDEWRVFILATATLFCIGAANALFNNYAETAFLKRYGVHFLPTLILINSLVTFAVMTLIGRLLTRHSGQTVLCRLLVFCAVSAALIRLAVPLELQLLYPLVYIMKTQFELLSTFLFWNLANQTFSTRQSKRMFPLLVSGGLIGGLSGSVATPWLAKLGAIDNLLWAYAAGTVAAALLIGRLTRAINRNEADGSSKTEQVRPRSSMLADLRQALPVLQRSGLVRWLVLLTLIPNMVVPLLNYQVSFAVDMTYPDEAAMLGFFSLYRAAQFSLALLVSLFAGRLYKRFSLAGGLLIHPFNYLLVFAIFLLQFDLLTAVYAGISVGVIRRAIQTPARAALLGLFPNEQRALLMPFLRGVVVRVGALIGAAFVFVCQAGYFVVCRFPLHPQNLAPFGLAFTAIWLFAAWRMKKNYPELVLETIGWHGKQRGRIKFSPQSKTLTRTQLTSIRHQLTQAAGVQQQVSAPSGEKLVSLLSDSAATAALELLSRLAAEDRSGRLQSIATTLAGEDFRQRANAIEALEQLVAKKIARDLVRGLEKSLIGADSYPDSLLKNLAADADPAISQLARQLLEDGVPPGQRPEN